MMEVGREVKSWVELIQQLPLLWEALIDSPVALLIGVGLFIWVVLNKDLNRVFDLFERRERKRFSYLNEYVTSPENGGENTIKALQDIRDAHYFKIATGIYAEKKYREPLISFHEKTSHRINWITICRASPYLVVDNKGEIIVRERTKVEKVAYGYNVVISFSLFILALMTLTSLIALSPSSGALVSIGFLVTLVFASLALFVYSQNWPEYAAEKIKKEIQEQEKNAISSMDLEVELKACTEEMLVKT